MSLLLTLRWILCLCPGSLLIFSEFSPIFFFFLFYVLNLSFFIFTGPFPLMFKYAAFPALKQCLALCSPSVKIWWVNEWVSERMRARAFFILKNASPGSVSLSSSCLPSDIHSLAFLISCSFSVSGLHLYHSTKTLSPRPPRISLFLRTANIPHLSLDISASLSTVCSSSSLKHLLRHGTSYFLFPFRRLFTLFWWTASSFSTHCSWCSTQDPFPCNSAHLPQGINSSSLVSVTFCMLISKYVFNLQICI